MEKRPSIDSYKWWQKIKNHRFIRFILFLLIAVITYVLMVPNVIPNTLDIEVGNVTEADIRSTITIENKEETERLRQEAYESIQPIYATKTRYAQNQVERINDIFNTIGQVSKEARARENEIEEAKAEIARIDEAIAEENERVESDESDEENEVVNIPEKPEVPKSISIDEQISHVRSILTEQSIRDISDKTIESLLRASEEDLKNAQEITTATIYDAMSENIMLDDVEEARNNVERQIIMSNANPTLYHSMIELARFGITANYLIDEEATEDARESALESVEPIIVREGQIIAEEGQIVTSEIYNTLALVGLLDDHSSINPYMGLAILVIIMIGLLAYFLSDSETSLKYNNTHLLMYTMIFILTLVILKLVSFSHATDIGGLSFIVPVAMGTMLITTLLNTRTGTFTSMIFAIIASIMFNANSVGVIDPTFGIYVFFSSIAGVFFLSRSHRTTRILKSGLFVSFMNLLIIAALLLLRSGQYDWIEIALNLGFGALSGFLAAVLTLGFLPFFEAGFGILTPSRLIELASPTHPLLRKLLIDAPGTYHHSVFVANLAEGACEAIGANGLLARVGAYYHDLGKTKRPQFFIENQMNIDNPHDKISPQLSKTIIMAHPYDGADMLREYKMPKPIIDIAEQHHGTSLLKYFYHKANEESETEIPEEEFRYPGPKAQTREAAIVGIADCVEAAVRSMKNPSQEKIENLVKSLITSRLEDGQFDECDLTLKELNTVNKSICETIMGTFHSRIEYPEEEKNDEEKAGEEK